MKLFSFIAGRKLCSDNEDKNEKKEELRALAEFLDREVLEEYLSSGDLEVQERASVMHQFVKYVGKHLDKGDDISEDFQVKHKQMMLCYFFLFYQRLLLVPPLCPCIPQLLGQKLEVIRGHSRSLEVTLVHSRPL